MNIGPADVQATKKVPENMVGGTLPLLQSVWLAQTSGKYTTETILFIK
jgi:hypothetical protein